MDSLRSTLHSPNYATGITIINNRIYLNAPTHPHCNGDGNVLLSRLIAEITLKRYLEPIERVHHIDGNPFNNDPKNLRVMSGQSEHATLHNLKRHRFPQSVRNKINNKEWLYDQYISQYKPLQEIADEVGCHSRTISKYLKRHNIPLRKFTMTEAAYAVRVKGGQAVTGMSRM